MNVLMASSSKICGTLTLILQPVDLNNKILVLLKKKYQRSISEILSAIGPLGAKFIFIPLGTIFCFNPKSAGLFDHDKALEESVFRRSTPSPCL